jgi:hypothetical protein
MHGVTAHSGAERNRTPLRRHPRTHADFRCSTSIHDLRSRDGRHPWHPRLGHEEGPRLDRDGGPHLERACKPDPVPLGERAAVAIHLGPPLPAASCGLPGGAPKGRAGHPCLLLGLAPDGVCLAAPVTRHAGELLPHPFTLTSTSAEAVCSLLHFPRVAPPGTFPSVLPCGVRTFLDTLEACRGHPACSGINYAPRAGPVETAGASPGFRLPRVSRVRPEVTVFEEQPAPGRVVETEGDVEPCHDPEPHELATPGADMGLRVPQ